MSQILTSVLLMLCLLECASAANMFQQHPIDFNVEAVEECEEPSSWMLYVKIVKHNLTFLIVEGNLTFDKDFTDKMNLKAELHQWKGGQWKQNLINLDKGQACTTLNLMLGQLWYDIQKTCFARPGQCPIPKGTYVVDTFAIDAGSIPILKLIMGKYKFIFSVYDGRELKFCKKFIVVSKPA